MGLEIGVILPVEVLGLDTRTPSVGLPAASNDGSPDGGSLGAGVYKS